MARRWSPMEEEVLRTELKKLYQDRNLTIREVATLLGISEKTVFQRLRRLGLPSLRTQKPRTDNKRQDVMIPRVRTECLAELFGIMLGDGHVSHFQMLVTLGSKERQYAQHVCSLIHQVFGVLPRVSTSARGYHTVYLGSTSVTGWLLSEGLVHNKTSAQVGVPGWILASHAFSSSFARGFFDTDGSVYRLRHGIQVSFTNVSQPLLVSLRRILKTLGYTPSAISAHKVYLTKQEDVHRFFREIRPANQKHVSRYREFAPVV